MMKAVVSKTRAMVIGRGWRVAVLGWVMLTLVACALPQVQAEDRLFLPVTVDLLDHYALPQQEFQGTTVAGLSALTYDPQGDRFYALSDDRGKFGPSRFYELALSFGVDQGQQPGFHQVTVTKVVPLQDPQGHPYGQGGLDPEGMALASPGHLFISSEGDQGQNAPPLIGEFNQTTGQMLRSLPVPQRFLFDRPGAPPRGVRNNLSFEALTVSPAATRANLQQPFRLFTVTESALAQDYDDNPERPLQSRFLHYLVAPDQVSLIAEHAYPLDLEPTGAIVYGVTDLTAIDQAGHFLALERAYGLRGFTVKLYQLATGGATDTTNRPSLAGALGAVSPIRKRLVFDFAQAPFAVDNVEAMTLGPRLKDGSQSLLLATDNNFQSTTPTQLILLRLRGY